MKTPKTKFTQMERCEEPETEVKNRKLDVVEIRHITYVGGSRLALHGRA